MHQWLADTTKKTAKGSHHAGSPLPGQMVMMVCLALQSLICVAEKEGGRAKQGTAQEAEAKCKSKKTTTKIFKRSQASSQVKIVLKSYFYANKYINK